MTKRFLMILVMVSWCSVGFAKSVNERLDDIEKRLKNIEESLDGLKMFDNLLNLEGNSSSSISSKSTNKKNKSNLDFEMTMLNCEKGDYTTKIKMAYRLYNNYDKQIKLVDAYFVVKDLFGEELLKAKILKSAYLEKNGENFFKAEMDDFLNNKCTKLDQSNYEDYVFEFHVSKIALKTIPY